MIYKLYGCLHRTAKKILRRNNTMTEQYEFVDFQEEDFAGKDCIELKADKPYTINEMEIKEPVFLLEKRSVYPVENLVSLSLKNDFAKTFKKSKTILKYAETEEQAYKCWRNFIINSVIPKGYKYEGCHYAGYIKEYQQWCLPSWIWTNAALVRYYCKNKETEKAVILGNRLIELQHSCGGWVVRNDYSPTGAVPQLAPNDSCYMALNCCLELYKHSGEKRYLEAAQKTASWVMSTARPDGLIYLGYDMKQQKWDKGKNIVDIGFAAGLFAGLYEITGREEYKSFLRRFTEAYIGCFYLEDKRCFATSIDKYDKTLGGTFARGQGWALEGLIPAYKVLGDMEIKRVICDTVETLLKTQHKDGSWNYNLSRPLMGIDCKGISVIAKCLLDWYALEKKDDRLISSAQRALQWCVSHTAVNGAAEGGIFSYTVEGAVVHHMYTSTAFVYAAAYAAEVKMLLEDL